MDAKLLIDAIVQQTTVLIAHLSTASGVRAPLAGLADQVFVELSREIEAQGVGRKVVADMFGMALRSYQKKVRRLTQAEGDSQKTLWSAVFDFIGENGGTVSRRTVIERFARDGEEAIGAILNDLVSSGLVYRAGRGPNSIIGLTDEHDYAEMVAREQDEALPWLVWVALYRSGETAVADLVASLPFDADAIARALDQLVEDGRVERLVVAGVDSVRTQRFVVPVGSQAGWEAAVFDHYQTMCNAISAKLLRGAPESAEADVVGGATLTFDVWPGHPFEAEIRGLLHRIRQDVNVLWKAASAFNKTTEFGADAYKVAFYFGQYLTDPEPADDEGDSA